MKSVVAFVLVCGLAYLANVEAAPGGNCADIYCIALVIYCPKGNLVYNNGNCCGFCPATNGNTGVAHCPEYDPRFLGPPCLPDENRQFCEKQSDCAGTQKRCCRTTCGMECIEPTIHECKDGAQNTFYDGCNFCKCESNGIASCTEKACVEPTK